MFSDFSVEVFKSRLFYFILLFLRISFLSLTSLLLCFTLFVFSSTFVLLFCFTPLYFTSLTLPCFTPLYLTLPLLYFIFSFPIFTATLHHFTYFRFTLLHYSYFTILFTSLPYTFHFTPLYFYFSSLFLTDIDAAAVFYPSGQKTHALRTPSTASKQVTEKRASKSKQRDRQVSRGREAITHSHT